MNQKEAIIKINKLFNLATSSNAEEAKSAQLKAMALMVEHGLTINDLGGSIKVKVGLYEDKESPQGNRSGNVKTGETKPKSDTSTIFRDAISPIFADWFWDSIVPILFTMAAISAIALFSWENWFV